METEINAIVKKAAEVADSGDALRFSQAALNLANAMRVLSDTEISKRDNPPA